MLTHLSLFSGIGGFDIAAEWAGFRTVCFVEIDPFCQKVLREHWPDVPLIEDIRDVTAEKVMAYAQNWQNNQRERGELVKAKASRESGNPATIVGSQDGAGGGRTKPAVDLITAGVPCQPSSLAGKRRGEADDRWLWPETIRVLSEVRPTWACFENPAGILTMGFDNLLSQMEECGYETQAFIVPACAVNAPHRRDRVWIVAHNKCLGWNEGVISQTVQPTEQEPKGQNLEQLCKVVANTQLLRCDGNNREPGGTENERRLCEFEGQSWWAVEPDVGRVAHGIPTELDGGIDEQEYDTAKVATQRAYWDALCKMWRNNDFTTTPLELRERCLCNGLSEMSSCYSLGGWHMGQRIEEDEVLRNLWERVCTTSFQEAQNLLPQLLEYIREIQCAEAMVSIFNAEPRYVARVLRGVGNRVNRLKALGNAVVPQCAYPILRAIADTYTA